ncbi:unnamed protein product [Caenorhabditis angaria]|uniref:Uncharacterized protein n=1 Tax=Caenorhabditis angaria TaxID=860376 RepID=A0A9P1ILN6_9PELO|nr:unnamed protein product [Caenorhabditis angaria]
MDNLAEFFDIQAENTNNYQANNQEVLNLERKNQIENQSFNQSFDDELNDAIDVIRADPIHHTGDKTTLCPNPYDEYCQLENLDSSYVCENPITGANLENSQIFNNNFGTGWQEFENPGYVPSLTSPISDILNQSSQNDIPSGHPNYNNNNEVMETGNAWNSNVLYENGKVIYRLQPKQFDQPGNNLNSHFEQLVLTSPILPDIKPEFSPKMMGKPKRTRAKKAEMEKLSDADKIARRRSNARKNTANYNKRNKEEMEELSKNLKENQEDLERKKNKHKNTVLNINNTNNFMLEYRPKNSNHNYFPYQNIHYIESQINIIETEQAENIKIIGNNENILNLEDAFEFFKQKFEFAENDMDLKERNQNTYGSTKSRAKSEMEKSEMVLKLERTKVEIGIRTKFEKIMEDIKKFCKQEFTEYLKVKHIDIHEKYRMGKEDFDKFEKILAFFQLPDPL